MPTNAATLETLTIAPLRPPLTMSRAERGIADVRCSSAAPDFTYEAGYAGVSELLSTGPRPDALFCANDLIAFGAIDAMRTDFGLQCPEDVLVAGFDDIPPAAWKGYGLTSFVQDAESMVDATLAIIEGQRPPQGGNLTRVIEARLVERSSTDGARFRHGRR